MNAGSCEGKTELSVECTPVRIGACARCAQALGRRSSHAIWSLEFIIAGTSDGKVDILTASDVVIPHAGRRSDVGKRKRLRVDKNDHEGWVADLVTFGLAVQDRWN